LLTISVGDRKEDKLLQETSEGIEKLSKKRKERLHDLYSRTEKGNQVDVT